MSKITILDKRPMSQEEREDLQDSSGGDDVFFDSMAKECGFIKLDSGEYFMPECIRIQALMYAYEDGQIRDIHIPKDLWDKASGLDCRLALVFKYGQNMFQPRHVSSVSVGDIVDIGGEYYLCKGIGWRHLTSHERDAWVYVPQMERSCHEWVI